MIISIIKEVFVISLIAIPSAINSQVINSPVEAMKSHETLVINSIELAGGKTVVNLVIENRIAGGNFCADRNIFIIDQNGSRYKLIKAVNIPACPATYNFKAIGEKLNFSLEFPPLKPGTGWIDIIEECSENCFWFYGVTLDQDLNDKVNQAFAEASKVKPGDAILIFKKILDDIGSKNPGIEGLLYINIISSAIESGDNAEAAAWYKRLLASGAPRKNYYVKYLNDRGIKY